MLFCILKGKATKQTIRWGNNAHLKCLLDMFKEKNKIGDRD